MPLEIFKDVFGCPEDVHLLQKGMCTRYHIKGYCFGNYKHPYCEPTSDQVSKSTNFANAMRRQVNGDTAA